MLNELIKNTKNKSENQMKTLVQTIPPRIALYKVLSEEDFSEENIYQYMRKYMIDKVAKKKHSSTEKMELVPGFYSIYSKIFLKIMRLCRLFCDVDDVTYGGLKKIGFTRTKTLGYDGDCCDLHFYKNSLYTVINKLYIDKLNK